MAENNPEEVAKELGETKEAAKKEVDALERRVDDVKGEHDEQARMEAEGSGATKDDLDSQAVVVKTADQMLAGHVKETVDLFSRLSDVVAKAEKLLEG